MTKTLTLLPQPKQCTVEEKTTALLENKLIALDVPRPEMMFFTAQQARQAIFLYTGKLWSIIGGAAVPKEDIGLLITFDETIEHAQGYHLTIADERVTIRAKDAAGAFYGMTTLTQVLQQYGTLPDVLSSTEQSGLTPMQVMKQRNVTLPVLEIEDWPDFPRRGVMLDISRDKVPTMKTLTALVDKLASWKINELQLYTEHTFAYRNHPDVWADASPMTARQILILDAYCKERFIDLVPNQNSFGHMHRWFEHEQYMPMAETKGGHETPWGDKRALPFSLTPANPDSLKFIEGLFDELLPNFTSQYFNVGADETWDLGQGRSKALCDEKGKGRVYLDFLLAIYERTKARGRTMQYWGDIIGNHPELVDELPKDAVALEWGYEADHDFPRTTEMFAKAGVPFYVCPGTSSWCSIAGRTDNAIGNIRSAVENGLKHGAMGVLNTDWGDGGHWQPLPVSYLGFVYGAAVSWGFEHNKDIDLPAVLDAFVFEDKGGVMGKLAVDLGNIYQKPGAFLSNSSALFWALSLPLDVLETDAHEGRPARRLAGGILKADDTVEKMQETLAAIDAIIEHLREAQMGCRDATLVMQEFMLAAEMLKHSTKRIMVVAGDKSITAADIGIEFAELQEQYKAVWMARNRPGGLEDSLKRMRGERVLYE